MAEPYYQDDLVTLYHGDALAVCRQLDSGSVDCIVTSPPYFGLRDYGEPGQYGLEASPAEYVETMRALFAELRRVLADDGTLWLNLGDTYSTRVAVRPSSHQDGLQDREDLRKDWKRDKGRGLTRMPTFLPEKNLMGIPWRVAFALQDDGWILRNDIIWHKSSGMPESVRDRMGNRHEHMFLFSKSKRYWFDLDPIREPHAMTTVAAASRSRKPYAAPGQKPNMKTREMAEGGANPGDVWTLPVQPFPGAHFAVMPTALAERCIQAGCKPDGTVLDPFSGSGTTGLAAARHGRRYVGIDLSREYLDLSLRTRLAEPTLDFGSAS